MSQKTNPNIFRVGITNNWKSKYLEKKSTEHSIYAFKNIEIQKYVHQFLKNNGLTVNSVKLYFNENTLHIYASYFLSLKSIVLINSLNKTQNLKLQKNLYKKKSSNKLSNKLKKNIYKYISYQKQNYNQILKNFTQKNNLKKTKKAIVNEQQNFKIRRILILKNYKKYLAALNYNTLKNLKNNSFLEKFFESISLFLNKNSNIIFTLKQLNKDKKQVITKKTYKTLKKNFVQLRKYKQNEFFIEGVNALFTSITNKNSSLLIAEYIAYNLKKLKRHNFFLKFIKTTLVLFNKKFSNIDGIKIKIKGRFNGAPRAKHKIFLIGNGVPVLSIKSKVDYTETTAYTPNGTFGIKIWIHNIK